MALAAACVMTSVVRAEPRPPLEEICRAVMSEVEHGRTPVIVFNIDGTILDNRPRSAAILRQFVASSPESCAVIADSIAALPPDEIEYYVIDSFRKCGVNNVFIIESALRYWADNFFSNRFVEMDMPVEGAVPFIRNMHEAGALIAYVSGRSRETMLEGTIASLKNAGYPIATARTILVMKETASDSNVLFKRNTYREISRLGRVVAAFENEPREVNAMKRTWPGARIVLVKAPHSRDAQPLAPGIAVINNYAPVIPGPGALPRR